MDSVESQNRTEAAYITKLLVQVTLPHRQPKGDPPFWYRKNGTSSVTITPGTITTRNGPERCGYPAGTIPRLLLLWMNREVVRNRERRLYLGNSLPEFMKSLGLNPHNGSLRSQNSDRRRLHTQMTNLFQAVIQFSEVPNEKKMTWENLSVTSKGEIWWDFYSDGTFLFDSWIELGEHFFESLLYAPIPLSSEALKQLKGSSLELDLYAWSVYAAFTASKRGEPFRIAWKQLHRNLGTEYKRTIDFKRKAERALQAVCRVYPELRLEEIDKGIMVRSSFTPIKPKIFA